MTIDLTSWKHRPFTQKWLWRFRDLAKQVASWSKDSTKVGAVAVTDDKAVVATGYNGLPRGVMDLPERLERPAKYLYTTHAEANIVAHAARTVLRGTTVFVTHCCCAQCAALLINAGVARVVIGDGKTHMSDETFIAAKQMFIEAGVEVIISEDMQ